MPRRGVRAKQVDNYMGRRCKFMVRKLPTQASSPRYFVILKLTRALLLLLISGAFHRPE
jgi:hypothetical protein